MTTHAMKAADLLTDATRAMSRAGRTDPAAAALAQEMAALSAKADRIAEQVTA